MGDAARYFPTFIKSQLCVSIPVPGTDFSGQTIIITGSNTGLGLEAARHVARLNCAKLIIACRTVSKGETARKEIEDAFAGKSETKVEVWQLDLGSYDSVKSFGKRVCALDRLDAIVENAGISTRNFALVEGHESTITTNVVSTFLLALLVLPKLRETARTFGVVPRLTIVSSDVHFFTTFPESKEADIFAALSDPKTARMADRYNVSKAMELLIVRKLAALLSASPQHVSSPVILNTVTPGFCHSSLASEGGIPLKLLAAALARPTEVGGRTLVNAIEQGQDSHGQFLSDAKIAHVARWVESDYGVEAQKKLWDQFSVVLEGVEPGILKNI
ncbi:hypothetical protein HKX48_002636 [Thoreauomyces humboldtii]|nr:hypothetical protein HKX48_002636 [Thoreauomyces humboldtii]